MKCHWCGVSCSLPANLRRHFRKKHAEADASDLWYLEELMKYERNVQKLPSKLSSEELQYVRPGESSESFLCLNCNSDQPKKNALKHVRTCCGIADTSGWVLAHDQKVLRAGGSWTHLERYFWCIRPLLQ